MLINPSFDMGLLIMGLMNELRAFTKLMDFPLLEVGGTNVNDGIGMGIDIGSSLKFIGRVGKF